MEFEKVGNEYEEMETMLLKIFQLRNTSKG